MVEGQATGSAAVADWSPSLARVSGQDRALHVSELLYLLQLNEDGTSYTSMDRLEIRDSDAFA